MDWTIVQNLMTALGATLSGIAASVGIIVAFKVHKNQKLLSQRQLLLPLWDHMSTLNSIDPANPITPDAIKIVNTLELVALCCEGGMIDEKVILRTFRDGYMKHYDEIYKCGVFPSSTLDGEALLKQNKAAMKFYKKLVEDELNRDKIDKI
ncbi:hypothetical protein [Janthinobacterium sp. AD80]|uniref:hypothetical protein n=1 Tax=Janthinobacterium sp. AD80 TaxID=1528773 RepID=UPI0011AED393|nr:hypothetical protein [Janthinobacterium sp. AD80]